MVANKDAAERLGLTCSAAAEALTSLLSGKNDPAESISRCSALLILADLLTEVEKYLRTVFTPPEKGSLKRWLAIAKNYATVQSVKEKLTEYDARLSSVSLQVLMAVNSSTWTNVNDIKEMFRACQVAINSEQTKELKAEQARIKRLSGELNSIMKEDVNLFQSSNIDNMRLDQAADLLIDARRRLQLLKEELDLDNTPDDETTRTNIDAIVRDLALDVDRFAAKLRRKANIKKWMVPANTLRYTKNKEKLLGRGAFAKVFLGELDGVKVAVKLFKTVDTSSRSIEQTISKEIDAWNGNAREHLGDLKSYDDQEWPMQLYRILFETAKALEYIHSHGIIHCAYK
ncbi:hypothetical protein HK405_004496 [Cladochytrium tenue]|nr:hypothetical protein HK405_004496 [Cladochytrium tenue]